MSTGKTYWATCSSCFACWLLQELPGPGEFLWFWATGRNDVPAGDNSLVHVRPRPVKVEKEVPAIFAFPPYLLEVEGDCDDSESS
jgi:hypothetical protein